MNELKTITDADVHDVLGGLEDLLAQAAPERTAPTVRAITGPAAQGDLLFLPVDGTAPHWSQTITRPVDLISDGNGHRMTPQGGVTWAPVHGDRYVIGVFSVAPGASALIEQPRGVDAHDPLTLGAGTWQVRRQSEEVAPNVIRRVVD